MNECFCIETKGCSSTGGIHVKSVTCGYFNFNERTCRRIVQFVNEFCACWFENQVLQQQTWKKINKQNLRGYKKKKQLQTEEENSIPPIQNKIKQSFITDEVLLFPAKSKCEKCTVNKHKGYREVSLRKTSAAHLSPLPQSEKLINGDTNNVHS